MSEPLTREQVERACMGLLNDAAIKGQIGLTTTLVLLSAHDLAQRDLLRQREEEIERTKKLLQRRSRIGDEDRALALDLRAQLASMTTERDAALHGPAYAETKAAQAMAKRTFDTLQNEVIINSTLRQQLEASQARCAQLENNYSKLFNATLGYIGQVSANATIRNSGLADLITDIQALTPERPPA